MNTSTAVSASSLAALAGAAASEVWHNVVPGIMPALGGPAVQALVAGCVMVVMLKLTGAKGA